MPENGLKLLKIGIYNVGDNSLVVSEGREWGEAPIGLQCPLIPKTWGPPMLRESFVFQ